MNSPWAEQAMHGGGSAGLRPKLNQIQRGLLMAPGDRSRAPRHFRAGTAWRVTINSTQPGAAAALTFYHLVALLQQTLAFAILALLLLLDVGAFLAGHDVLRKRDALR